MTISKIIRAWKDPEYRQTLSEAELHLLPIHPAGLMDLTDADLTFVGGGKCDPKNACCADEKAPPEGGDSPSGGSSGGNASPNATSPDSGASPSPDGGASPSAGGSNTNNNPSTEQEQKNKDSCKGAGNCNTTTINIGAGCNGSPGRSP